MSDADDAFVAGFLADEDNMPDETTTGFYFNNVDALPTLFFPVFYDCKGILLSYDKFDIEHIKRHFEFVVLPQHAVLSRTFNDASFVRSPVSSMEYELLPAQPQTIDVDDALNIRITYQLLKNDINILNESDDQLPTTQKLTVPYLCHDRSLLSVGLSECKSIANEYTFAIRDVFRKAEYTKSNKIGAWSRARGVCEAFIDYHLLDVADLLEFHNAQTNLLWRSRIGRYAVDNFFVPIFKQTHKSNMEVLGAVINSSMFYVHNIPERKDICAYCNEKHTLSVRVVFARNNYCFVDRKCCMILDLLYFMTATLRQFHWSLTFDPSHVATLSTMFMISRQRMTDLHV